MDAAERVFRICGMLTLFVISIADDGGSNICTDLRHFRVDARCCILFCHILKFGDLGVYVGEGYCLFCVKVTSGEFSLSPFSRLYVQRMLGSAIRDMVYCASVSCRRH